MPKYTNSYKEMVSPQNMKGLNSRIEKSIFLKNLAFWTDLTQFMFRLKQIIFKLSSFCFPITSYRSFLTQILTSSDFFHYNYNLNKLKYKLNKNRIDMSLYKYFSYYTFRKIKLQRYAKNIKKDRFNVLSPIKLRNNTFLN